MLFSLWLLTDVRAGSLQVAGMGLAALYLLAVQMLGQMLCLLLTCSTSLPCALGVLPGTSCVSLSGAEDEWAVS